MLQQGDLVGIDGARREVGRLDVGLLGGEQRQAGAVLGQGGGVLGPGRHRGGADPLEQDPMLAPVELRILLGRGEGHERRHTAGQHGAQEGEIEVGDVLQDDDDHRAGLKPRGAIEVGPTGALPQGGATGDGRAPALGQEIAEDILPGARRPRAQGCDHVARPHRNPSTRPDITTAATRRTPTTLRWSVNTG